VLAHVILWLAAALPTPGRTVKAPTANPSPWRHEAFFELALTNEFSNRSLPKVGKRHATARLKVQRTAQGWKLEVRTAKWWSGATDKDCESPFLGYALDQDIATTEKGEVTEFALHPAPDRPPNLRGCPDTAKRSGAVRSFWTAMTMLSGAAHQEVSSQRRAPMPPLGPNVQALLTVSHQLIACTEAKSTCRSGILRAQYEGLMRASKPVEKFAEDRLTFDPEGFPRLFQARREEVGEAYEDLRIEFRRINPAHQEAVAPGTELAEPTPFRSVKNPSVDPVPWRGDETYDLALRLEGTAPGESWKHEAGATLTVRRVAGGFELKVRGSRWWTGSGRANCSLPDLVQAQDLDLVTDSGGRIEHAKLHPPPHANPDLTACGDGVRRQDSAASVWKAVALLSGAAKQEISSLTRTPLTTRAGEVLTEATLDHARLSCSSGPGTCRQAQLTIRIRQNGKALEQTTLDELTLDAAGGPSLFRRRHAGEGITSEASISFRLASPAKGAR
jgi:hypothetical protein